MKKTELVVNQIRVIYSDLFALRVDDLTVMPGTSVGLVGPNGSGKSTLLKSLLGTVDIADVTLTLNASVANVRAREWRRTVGYIADSPLTLGDLTFAEHVLLHDYMYDLHSSIEPESALGAFGLRQKAHDLVSSGSFGMRRCLSACLALRHLPAVILADEPFVGLDTLSRERVRLAIRQRLADGAICIVASHDVASLQRVCDRVLLLDSGEIVEVLDTNGVDLEAWYIEWWREHREPT